MRYCVELVACCAVVINQLQVGKYLRVVHCPTEGEYNANSQSPTFRMEDARCYEWLGAVSEENFKYFPHHRFVVEGVPCIQPASASQRLFIQVL